MPYCAKFALSAEFLFTSHPSSADYHLFWLPVKWHANWIFAPVTRTQCGNNAAASLAQLTQSKECLTASPYPLISACCACDGKLCSLLGWISHESLHPDWIRESSISPLPDLQDYVKILYRPDSTVSAVPGKLMLKIIFAAVTSCYTP